MPRGRPKGVWLCLFSNSGQGISELGAGSLRRRHEGQRPAPRAQAGDSAILILWQGAAEISRFAFSPSFWLFRFSLSPPAMASSTFRTARLTQTAIEANRGNLWQKAPAKERDRRGDRPLSDAAYSGC